MTYKAVIKLIDALPAKGENNIWIKAMSVQITDLLRRSLTPKCAARRKAKLVRYYELYLEREKGK